MKDRVLAIIPARGGSKRLPRKNVKKLNGKPLISYTIEAAISSSVFDSIMVNSDDEEVLSIAKSYKAVVARLRPDRLAGDKVKVIELILELAQEPEIAEQFSIIALLLPTCPFRRPIDIKKGFDMFNSDVDAVVSVSEYDFPYSMSVRIDDAGTLEHVFDPAPLITGHTRSQDHAPVYHPNGAFYFGWREQFIANGNFFSGKTLGYKMPRLQSVDIDEEVDFRYAEFLLQSGEISVD
ncbi:MAG: acylneuraminate cytidylyltransferase family protein [Rhodospirillaceae bacterium]